MPVRAGVALVFCLAASCGREPSIGAPGGEGAPARSVEQNPRPEPFEQSLAGTTVLFNMIPVGGGSVTITGPDGAAWVVEVGPFYIADTETTWDLFDVYVYGLDKPEGEPDGDAVTRPSKPYVPPDRGFGHAGFPAISMTYESAGKFCQWLSGKTGRTYRLPTEAEWLLVARRCGSDGEAADREWFAANSGAQTHAVAQKGPCDGGVHDLLGNVAEWVSGLDGGPAVRGGAYNDPEAMVNSETRRTQTPAWNMSDPQMPKSKWWLPDAPFVGFRLVCEMDQGGTDEPDERPR